MQTFLIIALVVLALFCACLMRVIYKMYEDREDFMEREKAFQRKNRHEAAKREIQSTGESTPTEMAKQSPRQSWVDQAYPLQQVTIKLQGTRHSDCEEIVKQLGTVLERLKAGDLTGQEHDDDFGYSFDYVRSSPGPTFFYEHASQH